MLSKKLAESRDNLGLELCLFLIKKMKLIYSIMFLSFFSCVAQNKLHTETIFAKLARVTSKDVESGSDFHRNTYIPITPRLEPEILLKKNHKHKLTFSLQGSISSGGHAINRVNKIRFEKGEQAADTLTLKYFVEIKRVPGKEDANVRGYNYTQQESYKVPKDVKVIHIELYEDHRPKGTGYKKEKLKLVAQQNIGFSAKF